MESGINYVNDDFFELVDSQLYVVDGTYGSAQTPSEIYVKELSDGGKWYVARDSKNINFTYDSIYDGVDIENLSDTDTITSSTPIQYADDLDEIIISHYGDLLEERGDDYYSKGGEVNRDEPIVEFEVKSGEREYIILYRPSSDGVKDISKMSDEDLINEYWGGDAEKTEYGYDVGDAYVEVYKRMTMGEYIDRGYAKGGETMSREDIVEVLKDELEPILEDVESNYEGYGLKGDEVEYKSRDGFIPFTDGGYEYNFFALGDYLTGGGISLPTNTLDAELERVEELNREYGLERFEEEYPEIVKELGGIENVEYNALYEAGYGSEAETLDEFSRAEEDTIYFGLEAFYYKPDNNRSKDGKHTIYLSGYVNMEAPYHRRGKFEDYIEFTFTFNSISDLKKQLEERLPKIEDWFDGKNYKEGRELVTKIYAKGGKVKRYIVHKGSGYDGEVLGSSDTYRGAKQTLTRLEKKGVFDDVDTYGIKDTEDYFYRRKDNKYAKGGLTQYDKPPYYMVSLINWNKNINRVSGRFRTEEEAKQKAEKLKEKYKERPDFNVEITFYDDNYNKKKVEYAKGGDVSYATIIYNDIPVKHRIVGIPYVYDDDGEILWDDGPVKGEGVILDELVMTDRERAEYSDKKVYMKGMDRDEFWKKYQRVELQKAGDRGVGFAKGGKLYRYGGSGIGYQERNKGKKETKKKTTTNNTLVLGGVAGLLLGIFLKR